MKVIHNSVGSNLFRNFYVSLPEIGEFDALDDGENSCAFFVSSVLVIFKKLKAVHGMVDSTIKDLVESGWVEANQPNEGDILVWEALQFDDGVKEHIGFSIGDGQAISTSRAEKTPVEHDQHFGDTKRKITHIYRMTNWD